MRIANPQDLGLYVRERRRDLGHTQQELATLAGVSRRWLADLEACKPTVEVGLVLKTLAALGLVVNVQVYVPAPDAIDLDKVLAAHGVRDDRF
jgi:y4mF family transcriptional regulator